MLIAFPSSLCLQRESVELLENRSINVFVVVFSILFVVLEKDYPLNRKKKCR